MKDLSRLIIISILLGICLAISNIANAQMQVERLNRGAIAIRQNEGYVVSWRLLGDENYDMGLNV